MTGAVKSKVDAAVPERASPRAGGCHAQPAPSNFGAQGLLGGLHNGCTCGGTCAECRKRQQQIQQVGGMAGNQALMRLASGGVVQAKLEVSPPSDPLEREADAVADEIAESPQGGVVKVQRACADCDQEAGGGARTLPRSTEAKVNAARGAGEPLPRSERAFFEPRLGTSLEQVRIHQGGAANDAARSINAKAFTVGNDIVFGAGQYAPSTPGGRRLLSHELAHVVQQGGATGGSLVQRTIGDGHDLTSPRFSGDAVLEACFDGEQTLRPGSTGAAVATLQHALVEGAFLLPDFGVDGIYEAETEGAVRAFQRAQGIGIDGRVGRNTMGAFDTAFPNAAPRGRAPIPNTPAGSGTAPTLVPVVTTAATASTCGGMNYVVTWTLSGNSGPRGGFIIQEVTFFWIVVDCTGAPIPDPDAVRTSPLLYFEAWQVLPNSTAMTPGNTDTFRWPRGRTSPLAPITPKSGIGTAGFVFINASARYHDNVAALPRHMVASNPATFAGILQSSTADPNVGGDPSASLPHRLIFHWNCCPALNATVLDHQEP